MTNVYINRHIELQIPANLAHLARDWQQICDQQQMVLVDYSPIFRGSRHYRVTRLTRASFGGFNRSSTRYATLENAVRAAAALAACDHA